MKELVINPKDKLLVIAPHPDDESIGCGSLILKYGNQVDVLVITNGKKGCTLANNYVKENIISIRSLELSKAMQLAGVHSVCELNLPDGSSYFNKNKIKIDTTQYTMIFVPNQFESHVDHMYIFDLINKTKRKQHSKSKIFEYEIWTPLTNPNYYLDCSNEYDLKMQLISCYSSQLDEYDYISIAKGLNMYRGAKLRKQFCEAFHTIESPLEKILLILPESLKIYLRERKRKYK